MNRPLPQGDRGYRSQHPGGHPDLQGLCLALADWSAELRRLEKEQESLSEMGLWM